MKVHWTICRSLVYPYLGSCLGCLTSYSTLTTRLTLGLLIPRDAPATGFEAKSRSSFGRASSEEEYGDIGLPSFEIVCW